jgi:hypothetical protein
VFDRRPIRIEKDFRAHFECIQLMMGRIEIVYFTIAKTKPNARSDDIIRSFGAVIDGAGHHRAKMMCLRFFIIVKKAMSLIICLRYRDAFSVRRSREHNQT